MTGVLLTGFFCLFVCLFVCLFGVFFWGGGVRGAGLFVCLLTQEWKIQSSNPACDRIFLSRVIPVTSK